MVTSIKLKDKSYAVDEDIHKYITNLESTIALYREECMQLKDIMNNLVESAQKFNTK